MRIKYCRTKLNYLQLGNKHPSSLSETYPYVPKKEQYNNNLSINSSNNALIVVMQKLARILCGVECTNTEDAMTVLNIISIVTTIIILLN